jgi:signal transduction histidine kinase
MSAISDLLTVLAHEMRTPIAAIMGYQELLAEGIYGSVDARGKEPLDRIAYSARQLLHLIDGVQEISMAPSKRLNVQLEEFEPAEVLRTCVANAHADATGRNVRLEVDIPQHLPAMFGDSERFCRAIDLAIAAAIKASYGSTIYFAANGSAEELVVTIERTGLTPERDDPEYVNNAQDRLTGSGLRLAIVRQIALQMNGALDLTPSSSGSTVCVRFGNTISA